MPLASTLFRSQALVLICAAVQRGEIPSAGDQAALNHLRKLRIRILGDCVLQDEAWRIAESLG
ncbi:MAG: hypothetical protein R3D57_06805 [Hyphomicrobiaceae bacterium]